MDIEHLAMEMQLDEETKRRLQKAFEEERRQRHLRQAQGIAQAKQQGVRFGRPRTQAPNLEKICALYTKGELSITQASQMSGMTRSTIYRRIREYMEEQKSAWEQDA